MTDTAVARPRRTQQPGRSEPAVAVAPDGTAPPATTSAPVSRPHPHALWLEAGGGTDAYDVDRFVGLLRQHGWAGPKKSLNAICFDVLGRLAGEQRIHWDDAEVDDYAEPLARLLVDELGKHGYRIHDITRCVRPAGDPLAIGRPMSPEEEAQLAIPRERPRRRRRRS